MADGKTRSVGAGGIIQFSDLAVLVDPVSVKYQLPMPPSDFANADINGIVDKLSLEEAVKLIAGVGLWHTAAIERLGIPAIKVRLLSRERVHII